MIWVLYVEIGQRVLSVGPLSLDQCIYLLEGFQPHVMATCLPFRG